MEEFYKQLNKVIKAVMKTDIFIVVGDCNAKVSPDTYYQWARMVGKFDLGKTNDRLLEFAQSHQLTLANTLYPHKKLKMATWYSPDGLIHKQLQRAA